MAVRVADVVGLVWSHPIATFGVLLFFTPPLFPVVVYFSPLLISTALVVLAMISMGSDTVEPSRYSIDSQYKRGWIDEDARNDGPYLEGERTPKRFKASFKDDSWFGMVKNWEGTGRAWVESVLSQESRRVVSSLLSNDDNAAVREETIPPLETTNSRAVPGDNEMLQTQEQPEALQSRDIPLDKIVDEAVSDAPTMKPEIVPVVMPEIATLSKPEVFDDEACVPVDEANDFIEITPAAESEGDSRIVIAPRIIVPPLPLLKHRSLSKSNTIDVGPRNGLASESLSIAKGIKSLPIIKNLLAEKPLPVSETASQIKMISLSANSGAEGNLTPQIAEPRVEQPPEGTGNDAKGTAAVVNEGVHLSKVNNKLEMPKKTERVQGDLNSVSVRSETDRSLPSAGKDDGIVEVTKAPQSREVKSAAELLAPLRQGNAYGLGTPSAAVALSEKLKVPLEDIMSLLAGDDKETLPDEGPVGKGSSSETTTSQDEEWSSSDEESPAPFNPIVAQTAEKKDL